jgi:hypothetical protein
VYCLQLILASHLSLPITIIRNHTSTEIIIQMAVGVHRLCNIISAGNSSTPDQH